MTILESGPFKLEASCRTLVIQNSGWFTYSSVYSSSGTNYTMMDSVSAYTTYSNSSGSYSYDEFFTDDWTWDPNGNYTESFVSSVKLSDSVKMKNNTHPSSVLIERVTIVWHCACSCEEVPEIKLSG